MNEKMEKGIECCFCDNHFFSENSKQTACFTCEEKIRKEDHEAIVIENNEYREAEEAFYLAIGASNGGTN